MNALHAFDDDTSEKMDPLLETINQICRATRLSYSAESQVQRAFVMGLWYQAFPPYMLPKLDPGYSWDLNNIDSEANTSFNKYPHLQKFQFVSEKGDSWHQVYRDLREKGWQRRKVWREGGRLQYLMSMDDEPMLDVETNHNPVVSFSKPEGYRQIWIFLDISIATCKQVQVGTKTVEQPVYETQCEDLATEPQEAEQAIETRITSVDGLVLGTGEEIIMKTVSNTDDNEGLGGGLFDRIRPVRDLDRQDDDMDQGESDPAGFFGDGPPDEDDTHS